MTERLQYIAWNDIPLEQLKPLLSRQFVTGSQGMLARVLLKKGCIVPRHSHPNEQITYILEGTLRFIFGEEGAPQDIKDVRAGEVLVIPANLPHSAEALEDTVDLDIFAPPREDWITRNDAYLREK